MAATTASSPRFRTAVPCSISPGQTGPLTAGVSPVWQVPASDLSQFPQVTAEAVPMKDIAEAPDGKILVTSADAVAWEMYTDGSQRTRFTDVQPVREPAVCGRFVVLRVDDED